MKAQGQVQLIEQDRPTAVAATPLDLLRVAVEGNADLDKLERLVALQERWQAAEASKAYSAAFAAFKAEAVVIIKDRSINAGPLNGKKYASLSSVIGAITPALSKHGMSASWKLTKDEPGWIEVACTLKHIGGHSETVTMGGPPEADDDDDGNSAGNGHTSFGGPRPPVDRTMVMQVRRAIADKLANGTDMGAYQEWEEAQAIGDDFAADVWAGMTSDNRNAIRRIANELNTK